MKVIEEEIPQLVHKHLFVSTSLYKTPKPYDNSTLIMMFPFF